GGRDRALPRRSAGAGAPPRHARVPHRADLPPRPARHNRRPARSRGCHLRRGRRPPHPLAVRNARLALVVLLASACTLGAASAQADTPAESRDATALEIYGGIG